MGTAWLPRRHPDFRRLWLAATVSTFGTDITHLALPFLAIIELDASPWKIGLLQLAGIVPAFLLGFVAGAWIDRLRRRPLMIACDWLRLAILITLPLAVWLWRLSFAHLLAVAAAMSVATTFFDIADRAMLPALVGHADILEANLWLTGGSTVAEAGGFASAGWLVQAITAPGALLIDAGTFAWSALTLRRIEAVESSPIAIEERTPIVADILEGIRLIHRSGSLSALAGSLTLLSLAIQIYGTVFLLYVNQEVGFSPGVLGLIFATGGFFSLLGTLVGGRAGARTGAAKLLVLSLLLTSIAQGSVALISTASVIAVALLVLQQAGDIGWTLYGVTSVSARQVATPDELQGRVNGSFHVLEFGGYLVGSILGGLLGSTIGLRATLAIGAAGIAVASLPILLGSIQHFDLSAPDDHLRT